MMPFVYFISPLLSNYFSTGVRVSFITFSEISETKIVLRLTGVR